MISRQRPLQVAPQTVGRPLNYPPEPADGAVRFQQSPQRGIEPSYQPPWREDAYITALPTLREWQQVCQCSLCETAVRADEVFLENSSEASLSFDVQRKLGPTYYDYSREEYIWQPPIPRPVRSDSSLLSSYITSNSLRARTPLSQKPPGRLRRIQRAPPEGTLDVGDHDPEDHISLARVRTDDGSTIECIDCSDWSIQTRAKRQLRRASVIFSHMKAHAKEHCIVRRTFRYTWALYQEHRARMAAADAARAAANQDAARQIEVSTTITIHDGQNDDDQARLGTTTYPACFFEDDDDDCEALVGCHPRRRRGGERAAKLIPLSPLRREKKKRKTETLPAGPAMPASSSVIQVSGGQSKSRRRAGKAVEGARM